MKFGVVNESTIVNRFVLHTLQRNISHLAVITRKTKIKLGILKGGGTGKEPKLQVGGKGKRSPHLQFFFTDKATVHIVRLL